MTEIKRGPCVHGNPCRESMCVEYGRSEAAAGPEPESPASAWLEGYRQGRIEAEAAAGLGDLHCARCDARIELRHYDYPQHVRDHIPVAEAAADVQQYWTDTGHMPAASPAPEVCPVCKLGWDRHLA